MHDTKQSRDQLPYALHKSVSILQRISDDSLQKQVGIGYAQFKLLLGIAYKPACEQRALAMFLGQTEASISRQIKIMQDEMKLVVIEKDEADQRRRHLRLTSHGQKVLKESTELLEQLHREFFNNFSDQEVQNFLNLSEKLLENIRLQCSCK